MKTWRIAAATATLLLSGGERGVARAPDIECRSGQTTQLVANSCVNAWPVGDAKFRWPDLDSDCDPASPVCDSPQAVLSRTLRVSECPNVHILEVLLGDHLARIRCRGSSAGKDGEFFVNLDSLSCNPRNVRNYRASGQTGDPPPSAGISQLAGQAVVEKAEARMKQLRSTVAADTRVLVSLLNETSPGVFLGDLRAARAEIEDLLRKVYTRQRLDDRCEPLNPRMALSDNQVRAQRTCRLLRASSDTGRELIAAAAQRMDNAEGADSTYRLGYALAQETARVVGLLDPYNQAKALSARMLLFYALKADHPDLPGKLKLIRRSVETGVGDPGSGSGPQPYFWELHAGFVFGGRRLAVNSGGGYDCSDFMASLLTEQGRSAGPLSTWVLKQLARYLGGELPAKSLSSGARALLGCFSLVELREGNEPQAGDFVVSNNEALKDGHVAIVKSFTEGGVIVTIENSGGGANTIMSKRRPLYEPAPRCPSPESRTPVRPDLFVLRLKAPGSSSCPLSVDAAARTPAGGKTG